MEYQKEPFDFKLFMMKMLGKWYQFLICTLVGAVLFGGVYYLYKVVYAPAREYQASATYYIEYVKDPVLTEQSSYFNAATLDSWLTMDVFTEQVLPKLGTELTVEELNDHIEMIMPSDVRVVVLNVVTDDPVLSMEILRAYNEAFSVFAHNQREINHISVQDMSEEAQQIKADIRTQRAFVLGGVLGLVLGGIYIVLQYMLDDAVYLPSTLAKRHGLTVFGTGQSEEFTANVTYAIRNYKRVAVSVIGGQACCGKESSKSLSNVTPPLSEVLERLREMTSDVEWIPVPAMTECPEAGEILRDCDALIVTVVSGVDKSGAIDRALAYYAQQEIKVAGAVLWNADEVLLKRYYIRQSRHTEFCKYL